MHALRSMWVGVRALRMFNLGTIVNGYFHFQVALRAGLESLNRRLLEPYRFGEGINIVLLGVDP